MISVENVEKYFDHVRALGPVSLSLEEGLTHVLLGASGSGKTTLLKCMMGLLPTDQGQIHLDGHGISALRQGQGSLYGYMMQKGGLFPHMTIFDNITLAAKCEGRSKTWMRERAEYLMGLVQLDQSLFVRFPSMLSGGQKQRVSLVRALMMDPKYVFLDEPFGALDPITKKQTQVELKEIFSYLQKTVILVTHDLAVAANFGHTVTLLHEGKVMQHGDFSSFVQVPASKYVSEFVEAYQNIDRGKV